MLAHENLYLLPTDKAIAELKLNQRAYLILGTILAVIAAIAIWVWEFSESPDASTASTQTAANPLQQYQTALQTFDPTAQLQGLAKQISLFYNVSGWTPTNIIFTGGNAQIELHSLGGSVGALLAWAKLNNINIALSPNGAIASIAVAVNGVRSAPTEIVNLQNNMALLVDRMMQVIPSKSVQIGTNIPSAGYNTVAVTITLKSVSPDVLVLVGKALNGLPVNLTGSNLTLTNGLLSGVVQLNLLGS